MNLANLRREQLRITNKLRGRTVVRIGLGNILTTEQHLRNLWELIQKTADEVGAIDLNRPRAVR